MSPYCFIIVTKLACRRKFKFIQKLWLWLHKAKICITKNYGSGLFVKFIFLFIFVLSLQGQRQFLVARINFSHLEQLSHLPTIPGHLIQHSHFYSRKIDTTTYNSRTIDTASTFLFQKNCRNNLKFQDI